MKIVDCYRPKPPTAWAAAQAWHEGARFLHGQTLSSRLSTTSRCAWPACLPYPWSVLPSIWWS